MVDREPQFMKLGTKGRVYDIFLYIRLLKSFPKRRKIRQISGGINPILVENIFNIAEHFLCNRKSPSPIPRPIQTQT